VVGLGTCEESGEGLSETGPGTLRRMNVARRCKRVAYNYRLCKARAFIRLCFFKAYLPPFPTPSPIPPIRQIHYSMLISWYHSAHLVSSWPPSFSHSLWFCFLTSLVCIPLLLVYSISIGRLYSSLASYASPHPLLLAMIHGLYRCLFAPRANRFAMMSSAPLASSWQNLQHSNDEIIIINNDRS